KKPLSSLAARDVRGSLLDVVHDPALRRVWANTRRCADAPCVKQSSAMTRSSTRAQIGVAPPTFFAIRLAGRCNMVGKVSRQASTIGELKPRDLRSPENQRLIAVVRKCNCRCNDRRPRLEGEAT